MVAIVLFIGFVAAISGWWLSGQRLMAKPWLEEGTLSEFPRAAAIPIPAAKLGLGVFLIVAGALFTLLISAYFVRLDLASAGITGRARMPAPWQLWVNTGALAISSGMLHLASIEARRGQIDNVRADLGVGTVAALVFVIGQLLVWRRLVEQGYYLSSNPANSFFYLLTGAHAVHVLGGFVGLGMAFARLRPNVAQERMRQSVELNAIYWHFLLLVWLVLFSVVMGWADNLVEICHALVT